MTRRVVTGHDADGRSIVVADGAIPRTVRMPLLPEMSTALAWSTSRGEPVPVDGADPTADVSSFVPRPGETRLVVITLPPASRARDIDVTAPGFVASQRAMSPGLAELFEPDHPGMHRTPTVDYAFVLSGEVWLELDDGVMTPLSAGDIVVQNATRHAWRNTTDAVSTIAFVLTSPADGAAPRNTELQEELR